MLQRTNSFLHPVLLSVISGVLLWLCWPTSPLTFLVFAGWVPLFFLEAQSRRLLRFWGLTYLSMLIWNVATTWWVGNTTVPVSGVLANVLNALLMTIPWIGYWKAKRRFGSMVGYACLVAYWLTFEYIHLRWEFSWPWLTLGNVFAGTPRTVQWYEWTGTTGGSLWVWVVNIAIFEAISRRAGISPKESALKAWRMVALIIVIPLLVSMAIGHYRKDMGAVPGTGPNTVIVQPNIDPYTEKFTQGSEGEQLNKLISLSESKIDSNTTFVIWPETALPFPINEDSFWNHESMQPLSFFLKKHPQIHLITGLDGYRYLPRDSTTKAMRYDSATHVYYEEYNTAVQLDTSSRISFHHKGKLVPGAEIIPYTWLFGFLEKFSLDMGGTSGTLGRGTVRAVFVNPENGFRIGPIICYESIYSAYVAEYVRNGANILTIITNDAWWGDTEGYRQHEQYARLRAIETRRWVARSANTGISCFIDPLGKVYQAQPWNTASAIKMIIPKEDAMTLYVQWGDWLSVIAIGITILGLMMGVYGRFRKIK